MPGIEFALQAIPFGEQRLVLGCQVGTSLSKPVQKVATSRPVPGKASSSMKRCRLLATCSRWHLVRSVMALALYNKNITVNLVYVALSAPAQPQSCCAEATLHRRSAPGQGIT